MPRLADKQGLAQPKLDGLAVPADMQSATHPLGSLLPTKNERPFFFNNGFAARGELTDYPRGHTAYELEKRI